MLTLHLRLFLLLICLISFQVNAGIYKYQDEKGKWFFADKKPSSKTVSSLEKLHYKGNKKAVKPHIVINKIGQQFELVVHNPYFAPIEMHVQSSMFTKGFQHQIIAANSSVILLRKINKTAEYKFYWTIGDPTAQHRVERYQFPVASKQPFKITQSFNGRFSHKEQPNKYAVDIALPVGTNLIAARDGTVIRVKDNFHLGAAKQYFIDKANVIAILHDDGSYATYAHILLGSALVKPGDRVTAGDKIARSGASGYSTGPHLHFVVRRNSGFKTVSEKFNFIDGKQNIFTPAAGMYVEGF